jgi:hypothetical protein
MDIDIGETYVGTCVAARQLMDEVHGTFGVYGPK